MRARSEVAAREALQVEAELDEEWFVEPIEMIEGGADAGSSARA